MRVFVVWFRMLEDDELGRWPREVFTDSRVEQRWDESKAAGKWFLENLRDMRPAHDVAGTFPQRVDAMWDTWMLFDRGAAWKESTPDGLLSWGYTIMKTRQQFQDDLEAVSAAYQRLELVLLDRAFNGTEKVVRRRDGSEERMLEYSNQLGLTLLKMHRDTALEAAPENEPENIEEIRERLFNKLERLRKREEARSSAG